MSTTERPRQSQPQQASEFDQLIGKEMQTRPELLQMRMENEAIMAECRVRPRDFQDIKYDLQLQLQAFPELAETSIYSKPCGKDEYGKQKIARNLSIRAAEVLSEAYGFNRVRSDATPLDEDHVKVEATFTDFQRGRIWQDGGIVTRIFKRRDGRLDKHPDDRFYGVVVKAEASRRVREVILRSVNAGLKAWFFAECEKAMTKLLDDGKVAAIVKKFAEYELSAEQVEILVGRPAKMGWTEQDRLNLLGMYNALKDGEVTAAELLGEPVEPPVGKRITTQQLPQQEPQEQEAAPAAPGTHQEGERDAETSYSLEQPTGCQEGWRATEGLPRAVLVALESAVTDEAVTKVSEQVENSQLGVTTPEAYDASCVAIGGRLAELEESRGKGKRGKR